MVSETSDVLEPLDPSATLVILDVQALTLPNARAVPADSLIERIRTIADGFRASGRAVAYVISTGTPGGRTDLGSGARRWPEGALSVPDEIRPDDGDQLYRRAAWGAFAGTALQEDLRRRGSKQLVVVGLATTFGVESTVRAAYDLGFEVIVPVDAVSGPDPQAHDLALRSTFPLLARTVSADDLIAALESPSGGDRSLPIVSDHLTGEHLSEVD